MEELDEKELKNEIDEIFNRINNIITNFEKHDPSKVNEEIDKENDLNQIQEV
jgi:hypothetical protein